MNPRSDGRHSCFWSTTVRVPETATDTHCRYCLRSRAIASATNVAAIASFVEIHTTVTLSIATTTYANTTFNTCTLNASAITLIFFYR